MERQKSESLQWDSACDKIRGVGSMNVLPIISFTRFKTWIPLSSRDPCPRDKSRHTRHLKQQ